MVEFYLKLTRNRMENGMTKEAALAKVPAKWRDAVRQALEAEQEPETEPAEETAAEENDGN